MKRRAFLQTAASITTAWTSNIFAQTPHQRDVTYDPNQPLESTGLRIRDVVKILKKGEKNNVAPVLREEILENPNAVFIIYANVKTEQDEN